jgi:hypothetical protein
MTNSQAPDDETAQDRAGAPAGAAAFAAAVPRAKIGRILDDDEEGFGFEYDDTLGRKNTMRLDALTYEGAIREARLYLGIQPDDRDADGSRWEIE